MPGRHDAPASQRRRWAPTAIDAVVAITPTASLAAAFGLAGGGYLTGREDVAACGALAGAFGLVVERFATRGVRIRLRRERARYRGDLQGVSRLLHEVQRDLAGLRSDLDEVRAERDAVRDELQGTLTDLARARSLAAAPASAEAEVGTAVGTALPTLAIVEEEILAEPVQASVPDSAEDPAEADAAAVVAVATKAAVVAAAADEPVAPRLPLSLLVPGQMRSPIATGGIPVLAPGPSEPVRVVDLRLVGRPGADDETQPLPVMTPQLVDALVYASIAEAEAAELTRALELPGADADADGGRHAGPLHTGDAHHAGDYARELVSAGVGGGGTATLYIVRRGKHVA